MGLSDDIIEGEVVEESITFLPDVPVCQQRHGSCMAGCCWECPLVFGGGTFPDPTRKGASFTTPRFLCPCACHSRPARVFPRVETN